MKSIIYWKNYSFSFGMIVFLMLFVISCTPGGNLSVKDVAPTITSANSATFTVGTAGTFTVTATGIPTPTFALTGDTLPSGITFNTSTGVLSGTPASGTGGTYSLTITATNGVSPDATQSFTLTVYTTAAMIISTVNEGPWGQIANFQDGMNAVFGAGNWTQLDIDTEDGSAFGANSPYKFIYLDGSDDNGGPSIVTYLAAHITAVETWVNNGGRLYINAATQGPNVDAPFGVLLEYGYHTSNAGAVDASHPIFNGPFTPAGTSFTGDWFAHNRVVGANLTDIIVNTDDGTMICLASAVQGSGLVVYGGITSDVFHTPSPNAHNLYKNTLYYTAGLGE